MNEQFRPVAPRLAGLHSRKRAQIFGALLTRDALFLVALAFFLLHLGTRSPIRDPDLGWHLKGGEHVWRHAWPPTRDEFSYTIQGQPWIAYSWLAELVFWLLADGISFRALILFCAALLAAAFMVVYLTCRGGGASPPAAFAATVLAAIASAPTMTQRPGIASYMLAALFWRATLRHRQRQPVRLWVLVPLMVVWANVHVFFVFGLAWLWAAVLWELAEGAARRRPAPGRGVLPLTLTALACSAAVLVNPYGVRLVMHVLEITTQPSSLPIVVEFASPDFHGPAVLVLPLLLALIATLAWAAARPDPFELVLVLVHAALALYMVRNAPFLAIAAAPMLAHAATRAFPARADQPSSTVIRIQGVLVLVMIALAVRTMPRHAGFEPNVDSDFFPVEAVEFLKAQPPLGRMMNTFDWGGFLIYTLYPRYHVSIDGRAGAYGVPYTLTYLRAQFGGEGWQTYVDRLAPDFVLGQRHSTLAALLAQSPRWTQVYVDKVAVIFVRADHPLRAQLDHGQRRRDTPMHSFPATPSGPAAPSPSGARR